MTKYFISRHHGAVEWAAQQGIEDAVLAPHFDPAVVQGGDQVIGTLPIHLAYEVCRRGGAYLHLVMELPADARGKELTAEDMTRYGARLLPFTVGSPVSAIAEVITGTWDANAGEYAVDEHEPAATTIRAGLTVQGAELRLLSPNHADPRYLFAERLSDSWRINISMNYDDVNTQIALTDAGDINIS
ncbi:CRISPR-associated protein Csx16 [Thiomonas sp.]